ncbi:MAG TPA: RNA 2',3'-cyclic phosphodiesterase [Actinomycetota bacterium]|nr:RNA 2',3'-cyclic phosphodiesterase [Actinomycetota bacterium]
MARDRASRPEAKPLRLFVAFDVPDEALDAIERAESPFRERHSRGRWVPRENRHVTLKFLGATWPRLVEWVHEAVRDVAASVGPMPTRVTGIGAFPNAHRARVLWAGFDDPDGRMASLVTSLDRALAREFEPEKRGFTAHLTIARFDPPVSLEGLGVDATSEGFLVDRIVLYRSHLRRPAPIYEPLEVFRLGP